MRDIYLDNSATTVVAEPVAREIYDMLVHCYGNPSSLHLRGFEAESRLNAARKQLALALDCEDGEIYFTSGGSEANNLALFGITGANARRGNRIVITAFEHSSVEGAAGALEQAGWEVVRVRPDAFGHIDAKQVIDAVNSKTVLVSCMYVNNEVGAVVPIEEIVRGVRRKNPATYMHSDLVQAFGKMPVSLRRLDLDLATVSAHKIYGPKGAGALFIKKGVRVIPRQFGGSQEKRIRPGTEPVSLLVGFGKAAELAVQHLREDQYLYGTLNRRLRDFLTSRPEIVINSPPDAVASLINISIPGYRSETMMHFLEERGISVSSGSACSKGAKSHVLGAMNLPQSRIDSALRISFGRFNTVEDVDALALALTDAISGVAHR